MQENEYREINHSSLGRILQHTQNVNRSFATITAFRTEDDIKTNKANTKKLAGEVRSAGYGYFWVKGFWKSSDTGKEYKEDSIFIVGNENEGDKLKSHVKKWIRKYGQEAAVFKPEGKDMGYLLWQNGKLEKIGKFKPHTIGDAYSRLRNTHTYTFSSYMSVAMIMGSLGLGESIQIQTRVFTLG